MMLLRIKKNLIVQKTLYFVESKTILNCNCQHKYVVLGVRTFTLNCAFNIKCFVRLVNKVI